MRNVLFARAIVAVATMSLLACPLPARAEENIRCESHGLRYNYCRVDTDNRVSLVKSHGLLSCRQGESWGFDRHGVWVDRGCKGEFKVGKDRRDKDRALAAGAAVAGVAIIAALAARKNQEAEVASWAVGSFNGYDSVEGAGVDLTILPGGTVSGMAGRNEFTGSFRGERLEAGRHVFRVERSSDGFTATDERDANHRVYFRRTGGGY